MVPQNNLWFFVYGSLKCDGYFGAMFDNYRLSVEDATLEDFDMYDLGSFPGIIPGTRTVEGEIHSYTREQVILNEFDRIEGFNNKRPKESLYLRTTQQILTNDGLKKAIVYVLNPVILDRCHCKLIENGLWINN